MSGGRRRGERVEEVGGRRVREGIGKEVSVPFSK